MIDNKLAPCGIVTPTGGASGISVISLVAAGFSIAASF
jgi:hypothetical protein